MTAAGRISPTKVTLLGVVGVLGAVAVAQEISQGFPSSFAVQIARAKEIYVATERKNGARSNAAPVWFGIVDNVIYFATKPDSYKARRIGRGSPAWVSVQGKHGPFIKLKATLVKDPAIADRLGELYAQKYWMAWAGLYRPGAEKIADGSNVLIRLAPE